MGGWVLPRAGNLPLPRHTPPPTVPVLTFNF